MLARSSSSVGGAATIGAVVPGAGTGAGMLTAGGMEVLVVASGVALGEFTAMVKRKTKEDNKVTVKICQCCAEELVVVVHKVTKQYVT